MLGLFEGTSDEKLEQVRQLFAVLVPQASCSLSLDRSEIVCQARGRRGEMHVETLPVIGGILSAESTRHAAMRIGKGAHPAESIGEWERWASAWHVIQNYGDGALAYVDNRIGQLEEDGSTAGVEVFQALRQRVVVLQAEPDAWPGQA